MFCSECGKPAQGKFCSHCGTPLAAVTPESPTIAVEDVIEAQIVIDWDHEVCYETLMRDEGVRNSIEAHARGAKKRMTAEQYLSLADKLIPQPVSFEGIAAIAQPICRKLGLQTSKNVSVQVEAPVARVIVRTLCSLARHGQTLRNVTQGKAGCTIEAELPSDLLSAAGSLHIALWRLGRATGVAASTKIEGQWMDWGKSRRCLDRLIGDLQKREPLQVAA